MVYTILEVVEQATASKGVNVYLTKVELSKEQSLFFKFSKYPDQKMVDDVMAVYLESIVQAKQEEALKRQAELDAIARAIANQEYIDGLVVYQISLAGV